MSEIANEQIIKNYLVSLGISKYHQGFYSLKCFLKIYTKMESPVVSINDVYNYLIKDKSINCEYNIFYHRCYYAIKSADNPEISNKSVKEFFYDAYESIRETVEKDMTTNS